MKHLLVAAVFLIPSFAAAATGPVALASNGGKFGDWIAASYGSGAAKACYAFTTASASTPKVARGGPVMLTVTERKSGRDEVTLSAGYTYPASAAVTLDAGGGPITFYTKGGTAFTTAGSAAIKAFQAGSSAVAKSSAPGGGTVTDTFSLSGFSGAYSAITAACP
jgi:hypothetical protein